MEPQLLVNILIQEDFPRANGALDSGESEFIALLQNLNGKGPADRGESFQKLIERFTVLAVVEQRLHGETGTAKYRRPMHDFGIARNDFLRRSLSLSPLQSGWLRWPQRANPGHGDELRETGREDDCIQAGCPFWMCSEP